MSIGRALFDRCAAAARSAGARRIECSASLNADNFYARLGFETTRRIEIPMAGTVLAAVLMERPL